MRQALFHPRYYPITLPLFTLSIIGTLIFHFLYWTPLQDRLAQHDLHWQAGRVNIVTLEKGIQAQQKMHAFRERLPERGAFPKIISMLSSLAEDHQLTLPEITYKNEPVKGQRLTRIAISFGVFGTYENIRAFIRAVEYANYFLIIEDIYLLKPGPNPMDPIQLQLQVVVYLRGSNAITTSATGE